jgi:hypothetical protein
VAGAAALPTAELMPLLTESTPRRAASETLCVTFLVKSSSAPAWAGDGIISAAIDSADATTTASWRVPDSKPHLRGCIMDSSPGVAQLRGRARSIVKSKKHKDAFTGVSSARLHQAMLPSTLRIQEQ